MRYKKGSFVTIPNKDALRGLDPAAQILFFWICSFSNDEGICFPSYERLAECTGFKKRTVIKKMHILVKHGFIEKCARKDPEGAPTSNAYSILIIDGGGDFNTLSPSALNAPKLNTLSLTKEMQSLPTEDESPSKKSDEDASKEPTPNQEAFRLQSLFVELATKELGSKPLLTKAAYVLIHRAFKNGFTPKNLEEVITSWFSENKKNRDLMQITQCLSSNRLNAWKADNYMK